MDSAFKTTTKEPSWTIDAERHTITEINAAAQSMLGYQRADLIGKPLSEMLPQADWQRLEHALKAHAVCLNSEGRWPMTTGTGGQICVELTWAKGDHAGRSQILMVARDYSDLVAAEAELEKANILIRVASRVAELGSWSLDAATGMTSFSPEIFRILDLPFAKELTRDEVLKHYAPEYRAMTLQAFGDCIATGKEIDEVVEGITTSGKRLWVRIVGEPVRDAGGAIIGARGALQNIDKLVQDQEELDLVARRLKLVLESSDIGFMTLDSALRVTFQNQQAEKMLGAVKGAQIGKNFLEILPAETVDQCRSVIEAAVSSRQQQVVDCHFGQLKAWYRILFSPAAPDLVLYLSDVTERRRQEDQLKLLETAVTHQFEMLEITESSIDAPEESRFIYVNPAFERITGYTQAEVIGKTHKLLAGPLSDQQQIQRIKQGVARHEVISAELIHYRKDGTPFWREMHGRVIPGDDGKTLRWVITSKDITQRKEIEAALRASDDRFHLAMRATHELVWDQDIAAGRSWLNTAYAAFLGDPNAQHDNDVAIWKNRVHPQDQEAVFASWEAALAGTSDKWEADYRLQRQDGTYAYVRDRAHILRDAEGRAIRAVGSIMDMTLERELSDRLRLAQKTEAFNQMTGGVAHDFNNLLTIILGNAELIVEKSEPGSRIGRLSAGILDAAERGAKLTSQLLSYSSQKVMAPKLVNLAQVLKDIESDLREVIGDGIAFQINVQDTVWQADLDAEQLAIAIRNLAINAREAMTANGSVQILVNNLHVDHTIGSGAEAILPGDYVCVTVADTGAGIAPEHVDRIFEPYFTTKSTGKGAGLGLSMVFGFVKQSRGQVLVETVQGKGSTFKLLFPRAEAAAPNAPAAEPAEKLPAHILVVEDDPMVANFVISQITQLGYRVSSASGPSEALAIIRKTDDIDLMFSDVIMPGEMNGKDLAEQVTRLKPGIAIILTSGYTDNAIFENGRVRDGINFLGKPYRRQELAETLQKVLNDRAADRR